MFRKNRNRLSQALRRLILFTSMKKERAEQGGSGTSFFLIFSLYLAQLDVMPSPAVPDQGNHMEKLKLPAAYEKKYHSEHLKDMIADPMMWLLIPGVPGEADSPAGKKRLKENDPLFTFIDTYFPDKEFGFEPIMTDGRFVFLPPDPNHQGFGITAAKNSSVLLEVCHFWYPAEYSEKPLIANALNQLYSPGFLMASKERLRDLAQKYFYDASYENNYVGACVFPFGPDHAAVLEGYFLDNLPETEKIIRNAVKDAHPEFQNKAEAQIMFMRKLMAESAKKMGW